MMTTTSSSFLSPPIVVSSLLNAIPFWMLQYSYY
jgi:hypothetical protein